MHPRRNISMAGPKSQIKRFNYARICDLGPVIE